MNSNFLKLIIAFSVPLIGSLFGQLLNAQPNTIKFELAEHYIFIKVKVNDSPDSLSFIFDTGASVTIIDGKTATMLNLQTGRTASAMGSSGAANVTIVSNQKLITGTLSINPISFAVTDLSSLNYVLNHQVDGIIGRDIYEKGVCRVDFDNNTITLYSGLKQIKKPGKKIKFTLDYGPIPAVDASFVISNGETYKGKFLFDCGAGITCKVNTPFSEQHGLPGKVGKSITSRASGVGNNPESIQVFESKKFTFAGYEFNTAPILLSSTRSGVSSAEGLVGLLGNQIIQRFNFVLDYDNRKIYLTPSHLHSNKFEVEICGFRLKQKAGGIYIVRVNEESNAYKMGMREGNQLLEINGKQLNDLQLANGLLRNPNTSVELTFLDDGKNRKEIMLKLEWPF